MSPEHGSDLAARTVRAERSELVDGQGRGASKAFELRRAGMPDTIKALVLDTIHRTRGCVDYETLERAVLKHFPWSAFKKTHWAWYRYQCTKGRLRHLLSTKEKENLAPSGRPDSVTAPTPRRCRKVADRPPLQTIPIKKAMLTAVKAAIRGSLAYERATGGNRKIGITGEIGEVLACNQLGLRLCVDPRSKGVDAVDRKGRRVQIKTRRSESGGLPNDAGRIGTFSRHPFDYALLVILDREYRLAQIWQAEQARVSPLIDRQKRRNPNLAAFKRLAMQVYCREAVHVKESKRYEDKPFVYWWDIAPNEAERLDQYETIAFVQKDTGRRCVLPAASLKVFLTRERQTTRGAGNWGIKVLRERPDELAFEQPGAGPEDWSFLPVNWVHEYRQE